MCQRDPSTKSIKRPSKTTGKERPILDIDNRSFRVADIITEMDSEFP